MAERQVATLSYAVRWAVVLKYFGQLCLVMAVLTSVTLIVSLVYQEFHISLRYGIIIAFLVVVGFFLGRLETSSNMQPNEALVLTAVVFLFIPLFTTYAMMASGLTFVDAFFEAVSGVTTTGLSTLSTVENKSMTFLFSRAWLQWSGGLGIVVFTVAILVGPGITARRLAGIEETEDIVGSTKVYARRILIAYVLITLFGFVAILLSGVQIFPALLHCFAAVSTGGFSNYDQSLASLGGWGARMTVVAVSFLGAVPLALYYRVYSDGFKRLVSDIQLRALIVLCVLFVILLFGTMNFHQNIQLQEAGWHASVMALSAQTTTGFASLDVSGINAASKVVMILSMAIGGGVGSTAGGIKILRLLVLLRMIKLTIVKICLPFHAVLRPRLAGHRLEANEVERSLLLILLFIGIVVFSWLPFVIMGYDPLDSLFEVVSATGTVGISAGVTALGLPAFLKMILCIDMLMGRLEIIALLIMFYPKTWIGRRGSA